MANRPLLTHALDWLQASGVEQVMIVAPKTLAPGLRSMLAAGPGWRFEPTWIEQLPNAHLEPSLGAIEAFIENEPFALHLADSLSRHGLPELLARRAPAEQDAVLLVQNRTGPKHRGVTDLHSRLPDGVAQLCRSRSGGVAVLGSGMAAAAGLLSASPEPPLQLVAQRVSQLGGRLRAEIASDWWRFGPVTEALLEGNRFALEGQRADFDGAQLLNADVQGPVVVHPTAIIRSTVVRGPAIVGRAVHLEHAYIGPYTSIGDDVAIEGAEVENSIILRGTSISHLGRRIEASVVGPKARVFRDFRLPSAVRLTIGEGAEVSLT